MLEDSQSLIFAGICLAKGLIRKSGIQLPQLNIDVNRISRNAKQGINHREFLPPLFLTHSCK